VQDEPLPAGWDSKLSAFERLLIVRALRDEKVCLFMTIVSSSEGTCKSAEITPLPQQVVAAVTLFILAKIGKHYIDVPPFDLASSFKVHSFIL
jgi:hypothetical protein